MARTTPDADEDLLQRIAAKDQAALRTFFARHNVRLFRFLVRYVKSEAIAEELVNETLLRIWEHAASYDREGQGTASTWMFTIARNLAISVLRKRGEIGLTENYETADSADNPEVTAQKANKAGLITLRKQRLSPEHQEIVDLVYYQEKSIKEISAILGIPENTVKTRMFHARKNLSEHLRRAGVDRGWP